MAKATTVRKGVSVLLTLDEAEAEHILDNLEEDSDLGNDICTALREALKPVWHERMYDN